MDDLRALAHGIRLVGPANALRAVGYAVRRIRADRVLPRPAPAPHRTAGGVLAASLTPAGARVDFAEGCLELRFPRPGQVSLGWDGALDEPSWAVPVQETRSEAGGVALTETSRGWTVHGPDVSVEVGRAGDLVLRDARGRFRRRDEALQRHGDGWVLRSRHSDAASVHGLGGRGVWDLRDGSYRLWNTDPGGAWLPGRDPLYVTTPAYAAIDDVGAVHCFVDDPHDGTVQVGPDGVLTSMAGGPARWHLTIGSLGDVLERFTALTGRPTPPPRWTLGHHQARWGYGSTEAVRAVWRGFRDHDLPLSAVQLDIDHMDQFRDFTLGAQWQDLADLVAEMAADDVHTVVIVDAGIARADGYRVHDEGVRRGVFCRTAQGELLEGVVWPGPTVFPDFTSPDARRWWGEQFAFYADLGVGGYWHDMNEPACFVAFGDPTFPLSTRHDLEGRPGDHRAAHNVYGLLMCRASFEGLRRLQPDRRPFLFSRSGWAGMQRYGGYWSGDIEADWSALRATIHQAFGYGLTGVGFYGSDIGGFTGMPSPELFTRWFQLASFLPFFRTHCAFHVPRREPWEWGEEVMARLRAALRRRYRLMPYWYTLALAGGRDGAPLVRPLAWLDPVLRTVDDEFLVGDDVLVAPVLEAGASVRAVRLPPGTWFHGDTGERLEGGEQPVALPVGPDDLPWFVRAGAVLPTEEVLDGRRTLVLVTTPPAGDGPTPGGRLLTDAGDGWEGPHEERYELSAEPGGLVVRRAVVARGALDVEAVVARTLDGTPVELREA